MSLAMTGIVGIIVFLIVVFRSAYKFCDAIYGFLGLCFYVLL